MSKKALNKAGIGMWLLGISIAQLVFAQATGGTSNNSTSVSLPNPIAPVSSLQGILNAVANFLIEIAIPLTAIMALVGGFQMITSAGDPEKFSQGRKTLIWAAIGFAIVLLASGIATIITKIL